MFLNLLSERQKQSFLALATKVIMADGGVVPEENVMLADRVAEMGGDIKAPPDEIFGSPNVAVFDDNRSQTIVVLELLVLAHSDDEYHADEKPIIADLAEAFGIPTETLDAYEAWARRQAPLSVEGWGIVDRS